MNNFNTVNVTMFGVGVILIYCAVKDKSPREVIQDAFKSSKPSKGNAGTTAPGSGPRTDTAHSSFAPIGTVAGTAGTYRQPFPVTSN